MELRRKVQISRGEYQNLSSVLLYERMQGERTRVAYRVFTQHFSCDEVTTVTIQFMTTFPLTIFLLPTKTLHAFLFFPFLFLFFSPFFILFFLLSFLNILLFVLCFHIQRYNVSKKKKRDTVRPFCFVFFFKFVQILFLLIFFIFYFFCIRSPLFCYFVISFLIKKY